MKFILLFFLFGGIFLIGYRKFQINYRNKISSPQHDDVLKYYNKRILISDTNLKCHNWNSGIRSYHYLCNTADLYLTDENLIVMPYQKTIIGIEKWPPIIIESKNHPTEIKDNINGTTIKQYDKIEVLDNKELKIFFREKNLINSTVELNMKDVNLELLEKIELWKKSTAGNNV